MQPDTAIAMQAAARQVHLMGRQRFAQTPRCITYSGSGKTRIQWEQGVCDSWDAPTPRRQNEHIDGSRAQHDLIEFTLLAVAWTANNMTPRLQGR
jgi:hypothetical protein